MLGLGLRFFFKINKLWNYTIPKVWLGFLEEKNSCNETQYWMLRFWGKNTFMQWNHTINVTIMVNVSRKKTFKQWNYTTPNVKVRVQEKTICVMTLHNTEY